MDWVYVSETGERLSASEAELASLAHNGVLKPATLVWHAGAPDWQPAIAAKPEIFAGSRSSLPTMTVGRAVLEPLWRRRGWLIPAVLGLAAITMLRTARGALIQWPNVAGVAGAGMMLLIGGTLVFLLLNWFTRLGQAARTGELQEARAAAAAGAKVIIAAGLLGLAFFLMAVYDVIEVAAHSVLKN